MSKTIDIGATLKRFFAFEDKVAVVASSGGTDMEGSRSLRASGMVAKGPMVIPGRIPMARVAAPGELAHAILFLASPASSYIAGHLLPVDGGYLVG